ncbi:hypothetical protein C8J57DRAFT_1303462 [Mycena rebaudengoi]|nr:hypothetical protein C8J57DRAFT_1303462 [Mycena rebaudengoi]
MDYNAFLDDTWCSGSDDWLQTRSEHGENSLSFSPSDSDVFLMRIRITGTVLHPARVIDEEVQAAEQAVVDAQARLKQIRAESKSNSSGRVRAPHSRKSQPTKSNDHGAIKVSRRKHSTAQVPLNASSPAGNRTVGNELMPASTSTTSEPPTRPVRKRSGSMSLESDVPPKRLKLGL